MFWKLVKVEELLLGRDGFVRVVIVKVVNSDKRFCLMRRSVKYLYLIEVNVKDDELGGEIVDKFLLECIILNFRLCCSVVVVVDIL